MLKQIVTLRVPGAVLAAAVAVTTVISLGAQTPLTLRDARITITGTSNVHDWTAATTTLRVTKASLEPAAPGGSFWDRALAPGGVTAFEVTIPAATLASDKDGITKNMHKALKVTEHASMVFRLTALEPAGTPGAVRARGTLRLAGVEKPIVMTLQTTRQGDRLAISGAVDLLMTDYGIEPPKAMLGMLKTDPKVTVRIDAVVARTQS